VYPVNYIKEHNVIEQSLTKCAVASVQLPNESVANRW
jgi:hypothetical protein